MLHGTAATRFFTPRPPSLRKQHDRNAWSGFGSKIYTCKFSFSTCIFKVGDICDHLHPVLLGPTAKGGGTERTVYRSKTVIPKYSGVVSKNAPPQPPPASIFLNGRCLGHLESRRSHGLIAVLLRWGGFRNATNFMSSPSNRPSSLLV